MEREARRSRAPGPDARELLERGLPALGVSATAQQIDALLELARMLEVWRTRVNLTGHRSAAGIAGRLVLDAAAVSAWIDPGATVADLGSGAGFPGLPLAILRPRCRVTLIEARERRHHFQRAVVRKLGLSNALPQWGRAETLTPTPHQCVVAQAIARSEQSVAWMLRWAAPGGLLLLPSGVRQRDLPPERELRPVARHCYFLPSGGPPRALWIAHRRTTRGSRG